MKTEKWMPMAAFAALLVTTASCQDWGQQDPTAGNQTYPTLQNVAKFDFQDEEGLDPSVYRMVANPGGEMPQVVEDPEKGKVLGVSNGTLSVSNPLTSVVLQNAASLTFWLKLDEAAGISRPLIAFADETGTSGVSVAADGSINYSAADGNWSSAGELADYVTPGEWHFMAIALTDTGYTMTVDGENTVSKQVTDFDCSKMVAVANAMPDLRIGSADNSTDFYIDDLTVFRNTITAKESARPALTGGATGPDLSTWVLLGNEDNTTGFWSTWADYVNLTGDGTVHYEFYNYHGGQTNNWCNWGLVLTNGPERGADGYAEYLYLRADAYGWGNNYNGDNISHDFNWDTFMTEMDGAFVVMDITRKGTTVTVTSHVTATDGTERHYSITVEGVDCQTMGTFLTCEGSHLLIDPESVFVGNIYNSGEYVLGATDCSTVWWSAHSPLNKFDAPFSKWGVEFVNHTTGAGANWNNWLLVCTNGTWIGDDGYAENFVLRSDAYGWGASFDGGNTSMGQEFDWENYVADMKDCKVKILFSYQNSTLNMVCHQTTADGREMPVYTFDVSNLSSPIGLFFTIELAWLDFSKIGYYPWASMN